ncbi:Transposase [Symmachiella dynata]|uniref:Transposase n=1 Tax=Symmachiella dynata TaxID=2527995 RepID=A0A517ZTC9_9PLAN|nr:Transposase [Symmachiella dynata]
MPSKRHTSEQIITKLREAEVHLSQGMTIPLMCKKLGIHQQTYYKWRREYGGLRMAPALAVSPRLRGVRALLWWRDEFNRRWFSHWPLFARVVIADGVGGDADDQKCQR